MHSDQPSKNPFRYSGYYEDSESGMDYLKARYYSSAYHLFTSRDTYDLPDRYAYCGGEPVMNVDPERHDSKDIGNWFNDNKGYFISIGATLVLGSLAGYGMRAWECRNGCKMIEGVENIPVKDVSQVPLLGNTKEEIEERMNLAFPALAGMLTGAGCAVAANRICNGTWGGSQLVPMLFLCTLP